MDLFVVPTIGFDLLYAFVIVRPDRTDLASINVTTNRRRNGKTTGLNIKASISGLVGALAAILGENK